MDTVAIGRLLAVDGDRPVTRRGGRVTGEAYTVVPSVAAPRLVLPAGARRHAVAAIRSAIRAPSWRARLRQGAMLALFAAGLGSRSIGEMVFRDRLVPAPGPTLADHLSEVLGTPVRVGLRIGPARANQKPVLQVLDERARVFGFVKVAVNPLTRTLLAAERAALVEVADHDLGPVDAPRVWHYGPWQGCELMILSALPVWRATSATSTAAVPVVDRAMAAVARVHPTTVGPVAGSAYLRRLTARVTGLPEDRHTALLRTALDVAVTLDTPLEYGSWHGDWFPGNMALHADRLLLWDWERYSSDVPVGFDALHCAFVSTVNLRRRPLAEAAGRLATEGGELLAPLGVPADRAAPIVAMYLVEIATRYRADGHAEIQSRLGAAWDWVAPALVGLGRPWRDVVERLRRQE